MKTRVSKKKMMREIVRLEGHIKWIESCVNNLLTSMVEDIDDSKGRDKTKLRNKYFKQLAILFDFKTDEELTALKDMLLQKPVKKEEADESPETQ